MTPRTEEVFREAMALTPDERAVLLASLEAIDEDPAEVGAAWKAEVERRALDDESDDIPWEEVQADAYARLRKR